MLTYHPCLPSVTKIVRKHWMVMTETSPELKRCFLKPSVVAYKRHKNLSDILVRAKVPQPRKSLRRSQGYKPCGQLCPMCILSKPARSHLCSTTGKEWKIVGPITCKTENVIYKLSCTKCPKFLYIGETSRKVCDRFKEHKGYVTQKRLDQPTGKHFNGPGHDVSHLTIVPIERVIPTGDAITRKTREQLWISRYDAVTHGQNTRKT